VRLIIADCSAIYSGRGDTSLAQGVRTIMLKADGSVSIHNDVSNKPLNYMKTAAVTETALPDGTPVWTFDARHESLTITLHAVLQDIDASLIEDDPGLTRDGTEHQLQKWLLGNGAVLGPSLTVLAREVATSAGPVDLLAVADDGTPVAVEVKRVAMIGAVDQVRRYVEALRADGNHLFPTVDFSRTMGMIAALDIRPKTEVLAAKRDITTVVLPHYWRSTSSPA
jgi:RecB family endonuclease NucS